MSINESYYHPDYTEYADYYTKLKDCLDGEDAIKDKGITYLPMTSGQFEDKKSGTARYEAYKNRAVYYGYPNETVIKSLGILDKRSAVVELPNSINYLLETATDEKESLSNFQLLINHQQLAYGRVGILPDINEDGKFYLTYHPADKILNWYEEKGVLKYVLISQSGWDFNIADNKYEEVDKYLVLGLNSEGYYYNIVLNDEEIADFTITNPEMNDSYNTPIYNSKKLTYIPFVICNTTNIKFDYERPPLLDQANLSLAVYRDSANHEQKLFMQSFGLLYLHGYEDNQVPDTFAVDGMVNNGKSSSECEVGYATVDSGGTEEQRIALAELKSEAKGMGLSLTDKNSVESGKASGIRFGLQTAMLRSVAKTSGQAIEVILNYIRDWSGGSKYIQYAPYLDFIDITAEARDLSEVYKLVQLGGFTKEDYHTYLKRNNYTVGKFKDWESLVIEPIQKDNIDNGENDVEVQIGDNRRVGRKPEKSL